MFNETLLSQSDKIVSDKMFISGNKATDKGKNTHPQLKKQQHNPPSCTKKRDFVAPFLLEYFKKVQTTKADRIIFCPVLQVKSAHCSLFYPRKVKKKHKI